MIQAVKNSLNLNPHPHRKQISLSINERLFYISESRILTKEIGVNKNQKIQENAEDKGALLLH